MNKIKFLQKFFPNSLIAPLSGNLYLIVLWEMKDRGGGEYDFVFNPSVLKLVERKFFEKLDFKNEAVLKTAKVFLENNIFIPKFSKEIVPLVGIKVGNELEIFKYNE